MNATKTKCAGCGEYWPCSDSERKDISGVERAKHGPQPSVSEVAMDVIGEVEGAMDMLQGAYNAQLAWAGGSATEVRNLLLQARTRLRQLARR
jgi:hypothetical protein